MKNVILIAILVKVFAAIGCSVNPCLQNTTVSETQFLPLPDPETLIHNIGWKALLEAEEGCLVALGKPLILRPDYKVRENDRGIYLFERDRYIASVGDKVSINGYLIDSIVGFIEEDDIHCKADQYFLTDGVNRL